MSKKQNKKIDGGKLPLKTPLILKSQNFLRGNTKRLRSAFSSIRATAPADAYPELINHFIDSPYYKLRIFGEMMPKYASQLKKFQPLNSAGIDVECLWSAALTCHYSQQINAFVATKIVVSEAIMGESYTQALELIDEHERNLGISFWSFSLRLLLREYIFGGDTNNAIYKAIRQEGGITGYAYFLIFYLGFRSSPGSTVQHIRSQVPEGTTSYSSLPAYIRYKVVPLEYKNKIRSMQNIEDMIRHETNSSIVDIYQTLQRSLGLLLEARSPCSEVLAIKCAKAVGDKINDDAFKNILHFDVNYAPPMTYCAKTAEILAAYDKIIEMQFNMGEKLGWALMKTLGWQDKIAGDHSTVIDLEEIFEALFTTNGNRESSARQVEHLCTMLSDMDLPITTFEIARRLWLGGTTLSLFGSPHGILATKCHLPDLAEFMLDEDAAREYLEKLIKLYGERPSITIFRALVGLDHADLHANITEYINVLRSLRKSQIADALSSLCKIPGDIDNPVLAIAANKSRLMLTNGDVASAVEIIVTAYLRDADVWASLPIGEALETSLSTPGSYKNDVLYAIILDLGVERIDDKYTRYRSYAVEDVWESKGANSPSEIAFDLCQEHRASGIYYLHRMCTSDTLSDSDRFQSVRELEEERIRICQALIEIDPTNSEIYLSEIKSLTRWLVIYDGLRSIEQSKIYVDTDNLRTYLTSILSPEFDRMIVLRREKAASGDIENILQHEIVKYRDDDLSGDMRLSFTQDNPTKILNHIVSTIWNEFASNSHYGLDVYLSTRIRHGTLKGHLRSPLEETQLICQKGGTTYKDQPFWSARANDLNTTQDNWLQDALKHFSDRIDKDIALLNNEALRLRNPTSPHGWFDLQPRNFDLTAVERFLSQNTIDFQEFLSVVFDVLNRRLKGLLLHVQHQLHETFRLHWASYLRALRDASTSSQNPILRSEFEAAIANAQVAVDLAFERVTTWFTLSAARENPDYGVDLAIEIAVKSIENCFGSNVLFVEQKISQNPVFQGRTLASLVDMFFIVFENIVKHARTGFGKSERAVATLELSQYEEVYSISISNKLPDDTDFVALNERVANIKQSLTESGDNRLVTEGGTGFHKIRKILTTDLGLEHEFDFGVTDNVFEVTIMLDAERVLS